MDKTNLYIQKLIVFILVFTIGGLLFPLVKIWYLLPALFFTLSFLISRITGEKPGFLYGLSKSDEFLNNKAGFWVLFKWIVVLFGLIYDFIAQTLFGIYILFAFFLDIVILIKTIIFWIIHAIIWFLKKFVPPLVFIYKMIVYYVFLWNWWIYKISFNNIRKSINMNFYFISLWGAFLMLFLILLFYGVGLLMDIPGIIVIGVVFSLLPLIWSYGEISSLRLRNAEDDTYPQVRKNFKSGFDAVKAVLNYFIIFLLLVLVEVILNLFGWIPQLGFSFLGLALNINTIVSLILMFLFVLLIFAKLILPTHVAYNRDFTTDLNGSLSFLGVIGKRFLRYLFSTFSAVFFGILVIIIPGLIVILSIIITVNVKNSILDSRVGILNQRISVLDGLEKYKTIKEKERIAYYKSFPQNVISDFAGMKELYASVKNLKENIIRGEEEIITLSKEFSTGIDSLDKKIERLKTGSLTDNSAEVSRLDEIRHIRIDSYNNWEQDGEYSIGKLNIDLADKKGLMIQLPIVFLLSIFWAAFFAGLVLAFLISYFGNVYFELYNFREDNKPVYFWQVISELNVVDRNQPLLGFTLIVIITIIALNFPLLIRLIGSFSGN